MYLDGSFLRTYFTSKDWVQLDGTFSIIIVEIKGNKEVNTMKIGAHWDNKSKILKANINRIVNLNNVKKWENKIISELFKIPKKERFIFLYDSSGYGFNNIETHKYFRAIVPKILNQYNYRLSFVSNIEMDNICNKEQKKSQVCFGVALVHHDKEKMKTYDENYGCDNERYFSDIETALKWINTKLYK